jgi:hypothetical protein
MHLCEGSWDRVCIAGGVLDCLLSMVDVYDV